MSTVRIVWFALVFAALGACASVPFDYPKDYTVAIADTSGTSLAREVSEWVDLHDGLSGFYPLVSGTDAFGARLRLMESAERSIDAQYFLMKDDTAGRIFAATLLRAADRGVRVRFLLDDVFTTYKDQSLYLLDEHENIDVRLYNPIARGGIGMLNFMSDFKRANRRMHNKSFTVDNVVTIVGGRNIADEYFELRTDAEFLDFDVVAIGNAAADVSDEFDLYWNHERSVPMAAFGNKIEASDYDTWRAEMKAHFERTDQTTYAHAVNSRLIHELIDNVSPMFPATYKVITDDPDKLVHEINEEYQTLVNYLAEVASQAKSEVLVVTPYFVPQEAGLNFWRSLTARGIRVVIVTNSLASNNHVAVHSGYSKHRRSTIDAGVELYEARVNAVDVANNPNAPGVLTLHTKAVIIDREILFAGSLNLDPRSVDINAEMGVLIDSQDMVVPLIELFYEDLPEFAYRVELDEAGNMTWRGHIDGVEMVETSEPQSSGWRKFKAFMLKIVPDSQL